MELSRLVQILRKSWILIVAFALLGVAGGAIASLLTPVQYSAATRLFVTVQIEPGSTTGDLVQGNNFAAQKVLSYVDVVTSPRVLDPVVDELGFDGTAADLAQLVTATVQPNSVVIEIATRDSSPTGAQELSTAISESFAAVVVNELELPADGSASPVKVEVLQPALASTTPSAPVVPLNLALGLIIGLAIGLIVAVILGILDHRVHGRSDIERLTDLPVLGSVGTVSRKRTLIAQDPRSERGESFRTLRTNLQSVGTSGRPRSFVVTSSNRGEGRTTTVANLAVVLAEGGASVVVVDADLRNPQLADYMGVTNDPGLTDVLLGRVDLDDALRHWNHGRAVMVLPAGVIPPNPSDLLGSSAMAELLATLASRFDWVLVDAPPILPVTDAAVLSRLTGGTILLAGIRRVKDDEILSALTTLDTVATTPVGVVLTGVPTKRGRTDRIARVAGGQASPAPQQPIASVTTAPGPQRTAAQRTPSPTRAVATSNDPVEAAPADDTSATGRLR